MSGVVWMNRKRNVVFGGTLAALIGALGVGQAALETTAAHPAVEAPMFQVDPFWPKPLPNHWIHATTYSSFTAAIRR
jgi:hypothetical protein